MKKKDPIYLDYAATAPLDPRVWEAMKPFVLEHFGNASSVHGPGRKARHAIEESRESICATLGCDPGEVIFTGSGTEANNMALGSVGDGVRFTAVVTSEAEHESIRQPAIHLLENGITVRYTTLEEGGSVSGQLLADELAGEPCLVSLMYINNETGAMSDIPTLAIAAKKAGGIFHTDAVQAAAYFQLSDILSCVDMMTISAHKLGGPKGVGTLLVKSGVDLEPLIRGGSQERRRRAGTENVAGIVGLAKAIEIAQTEGPEETVRVGALRQRLAAGLKSMIGSKLVLTSPKSSAPHILHAVAVNDEGEGIDGEMLILGMDLEGVFVSSGSACTSGALEPSHVLEALRISPNVAKGSVRFSLGRGTTETDVDRAIESMYNVVTRANASISAG